MYQLSEKKMLELWSQYQQQNLLEKSLAVLAAILPQMSREELLQFNIGLKNYLILKIYESNFGKRLACFVKCPACKEPLQFALTTDAIFNEALLQDVTLEKTCKIADYQLNFRLLTLEDLNAIAPLRNDVVAQRQHLLQKSLLVALNKQQTVNFEELSAEVLHELANQIYLADPYLECLLDLTCPACQHAWQAPLDINLFLWEKIQASAQQLIIDVHLLATAYGWSEETIFALSPLRKKAYLSQLQ